jgi:tRNA pseudouridine55 synthase
VRRALKTRAVGHTGTLDPFATGLLVVLVGRATRLARFLSGQPKTYVATVRLGAATTTDDLTGDPVVRSGSPVEPPSRRTVAATLSGFLGPQKQRPPAFSAKRVQGERSHVRARRGESVELAEVDIHVYAVELEEYHYPELRFRTTVSAGTYVRAMGRDLGLRLGTRGHLTALRRESIGPLRVADAMPLDAVTEAALRSPLEVLGHLTRVEVSEPEATAVGHGKSIHPGTAGLTEGLCAIVCNGRLVAVGAAHDGTVQPEVVLEAAG